MRTPARYLSACAAALAWLFAGNAQAQWQTQTMTVKPGWNAVFLHVDASHVPIADALSGMPIDEVWLWNPDLSTLQFVTSPEEPIPASTRWLQWNRDAPLDATLHQLTGNAAYLIKVDESLLEDYVWNLQGKPVPPFYLWSSDGINLLGFATAAGSAPDFETFLSPAPGLLNNAEIYRYVGGPLASNPALIPPLTYRATDVTRGQAFWVRETTVFNRYFGPFELTLQNKDGVEFGALSSQYSLRIRNLTSAALTVTLSGLASETPPTGETVIAGQAPILVRGALNPEDLAYDFAALSDGPQSWVLQPAGQPGSERQIVLGLNRTALTGHAGDLFAGVLRFTDSLGFSQVDLPVSATKASLTGLWVGEAQVSQVRHDLEFFDTSGETAVSTGVDTSLGGVRRAFPLRLIVFADPAGNAKLLQRVYSGFDGDQQPVLSTQQKSLDPAYFSISRRISSVHLPWTEGNVPWPLTGSLAAGQTLAATVATEFGDQATNPFLHTYHPDHDNLNANFDNTLSSGEESYGVVRNLSLTIGVPVDGFNELTQGDQTLVGQYAETISLNGKGTESQQYEVQGTFTLNRLLLHDELLTPAP